MGSPTNPIFGFTEGSLTGTGGISGATVPINIAWDTTGTGLANAYANDMQTLESYLNAVNPPLNSAGQPTQAPVILTGDQLQALVDPSASGSIAGALTDLINLAKNGYTVPGPDPNDPQNGAQTYYLTIDMVNSLNTLITSFQNMGANISVNPIGQAPVVNISADQLQAWFTYAIAYPTVLTAVQQGIEAAGFSAHTIQAMVELDYVQTANNILSSQLSDLQQALQVTQDALTTLQSVNDLHNSLNVATFNSFNSQFNFNQNTGASSFIAAYRTAASAFFNQPIGLIVISTSRFGNLKGTNLANVLSNLRISLNREMSVLQSASGSSAGAYSLLSELKVVTANISTYLDSGNSYQWMADGNTLTFNQNGIATINSNPDLTQVGQIQQNITAAITSGESFNDTQKNNVQNFLYVFQEFYQSASSILQNLTQVIQDIARKVAQ